MMDLLALAAVLAVRVSIAPIRYFERVSMPPIRYFEPYPRVGCPKVIPYGGLRTGNSTTTSTPNV